MKLLLLSIILCFALRLEAQETRIIVSEDSTLKANEYDRLFNMMSENKTVITGLFKFNAVDWGQLSPSFIYEQKLLKNLSIEPSLRLDAFGSTQQDGLRYVITPELGLKYYHNTTYREVNGKNTNGFSGNYFVISYLMPFSDTPELFETMLNRQYFYDYKINTLEINKTYALGMIHFGYGIQRRFLNIGYVDCAFGVNFQTNNIKLSYKDPLPFIKIGIGFGVTPKKAKELTK